jgi:DNA-binding beta-propeller fold protein YncE
MNMTLTRALTRRFHVLAVVVALSWPLPLLAQGRAPRYEVDPAWPMPFPDRWVIAPLGGVCVDAQDHVFILHRQEFLDVDLDAGQKAPPVIELDQVGRVVNSWGNDFDPVLINSFHGCHVDAENNVWIVSFDSGIARKYSHDGKKLLLQIGQSGVVDSSDGTLEGKPLNSNRAQFFGPAAISIDRQNGDVYVADGDSRAGNRRVVVTDRAGKFIRQWQPDSETIHCLAMANDGLVYVCDRPRNRILVYDRMGSLKTHFDIPWKAHTPVAGKVGTAGSAVSVALPRDSSQTLLYVINQNNAQIEVLDRQTGKIVASFGRPGQFNGQLNQPLNIAVDSKGNVYVTENRGRRVQRFRVVSQ